MKILLSQNLLIALLIRHASRATFPDMGRLTDSLLPTIGVKIAKQFSFYSLASNRQPLPFNCLLYFHYNCYIALPIMLPY